MIADRKRKPIVKGIFIAFSAQVQSLICAMRSYMWKGWCIAPPIYVSKFRITYNINRQIICVHMLCVCSYILCLYIWIYMHEFALMLACWSAAHSSLLAPTSKPQEKQKSDKYMHDTMTRLDAPLSLYSPICLLRFLDETLRWLIESMGGKRLGKRRQQRKKLQLLLLLWLLLLVLVLQSIILP